ncbi:hypothetical protein KEM54_006363 [Ascosphaera aggregata]|nr:hypothetical protein KEM54_006363 [Ascosphaera aggregata]
MADSLYDLLIPYFDVDDSTHHGNQLLSRPSGSIAGAGVAALSEEHSLPQLPPPPPIDNQISAKYLSRLSTLSLETLTDTEPQSLSQLSHSNLVSLQALSNRSHKSFVSSADHLSSLRHSLPELAEATKALRNDISPLDDAAVRFSSTYNKTVENPILDRRKKTMQLLRNVDRMADIMELPTLLSTLVSSASNASSSSSLAAAAGSPGGADTVGGTSKSSSSSSSSAASVNNSYSSALDLLAHIKKLQTLYPWSSLVKDVTRQAEDAMKEMTTNLIGALRGKNIRLAAAMRTVGWLRRVAPELGYASSGESSGPTSSEEGAYGALFITCRLANLVLMLEALDPLRELADSETQQRLQGKKSAAQQRGLEGQQTERYLKRYIEIFREQSFAMISLYRDIFPLAGFTPSSSSSSQDSVLASSNSPTIDLKKIGLQSSNKAEDQNRRDILSILPPALATFPMHLTQLLMDTLKQYLPNVTDRSSRESLLTQVLYCSGSLGRLGANFSLHLAFIDEDDDDDELNKVVAEWETIIKKHRALAARLDKMTTGGNAESPKTILTRSISPAP